MRILGIDLERSRAETESPAHTLVLLDDDGRVAKVERPASLAEVATTVARIAGGEPFLLGVNLPIVVPAKPARGRPVENLARRRFGFRMPAGGRAALSAEPHGIAGEALMAGLAAAGQPCLPYPDRDRQRPGLAETSPGLILKILLWESSPLQSAEDPAGREQLFRAYTGPAYRSAQVGARTGWAEQAAGLDLLLRALGSPEALEGYDLGPARDALNRSTSEDEVDRAGGLLDAALIAGTARRYLSSPENCLFLGDRDSGYLVLPADGFVRRLALTGGPAPRGRLFPEASLKQRLGAHARLRSIDLLDVPGRPQRTEASFEVRPHYEFDNLDEMLWWKHCRHLDGPGLPTEGLCELTVSLAGEQEEQAPLKLVRSRHRTLSFRFEPPGSWRARVPTRDGKSYPFQVLRAVYETRSAQD